MRTTTSRLTAAAALVLATAALTACGGSDDTPVDTPATSEEAAPEETAENVDAEASEEPSEEPTEAPTVLSTAYDVQVADLGAPGDTTAPGTPLTFGQPAWVNHTVTYDTETTVGVGLTVLEVRALDPSMFDSYSNAEEFAGYTPYAVVFQAQFLADAPEGYDLEAPALFPIKEDGSNAEYLVSGMFTTAFSSAGDECGLQLPPYDETTRTLVSCFVGLTKDLPIVGAKYDGEDYGAFIATEGNQYVSNPIVWR
ncbi:hypothetical protein [Miniimonas sp. S16]|uniref:hypothetical protein n=1 Tax=Miniimonas sp. S16 TaxID=2171623 RepID=UPI000D5281C1|nr:hypothetical protein [Miniimonas sp. S16]